MDDQFFNDLFSLQVDGRDLGYTSEDNEIDEDESKTSITLYDKNLGKELFKEYEMLKKLDALPIFRKPLDGRLINKKFRIYKWIYVLKEPKDSPLYLIAYTFYRHFRDLVKEKRLARGAKVQIVIGIQKDMVVSLPVMNPNNVTLKKIIELLSRDEHYQSIVLKDMIINVKEIRGRRGGAGIKDKRRCVNGFKSEGYCGLKSLLILIGFAKKDKKITRLLKERNDKKFTHLAIKLGEEMKKYKQYSNLPDMEFKDFNIFVELKNDYRVVIFKGPDDFNPHKSIIRSNDPINLYIAYEKNHYIPINNVAAYVRSSGKCKRLFCEKCFKIYDSRSSKHQCVIPHCMYCLTDFDSHLELKEHSVEDHCHCDKCNAFIRYGKICKNKHELICNALHITCKNCGALYDNNSKHSCIEYKCCFCNTMVEDGHICYITTYRKPIKNKKIIIMAYDIESTISSKNVDNKIIENLHTPEIICAVDIDTGNKNVFEGCEKFIEHLLSRNERIKLFAHNGKAYDTFLIRWYLENILNTTPDSIILKGQKIIYMKFKNLEFLDSMNHFQGSLQSQIKTFDLKNCDDKGFFPYKFYTDKKKNYIGKLPSDKYFNIININEFKEWKETFNDKKYNIKEECIKYCFNDVNILKLALISYRDNAIEVNNLDPLNFITIASYAQKVYLMSHYCEKVKTPLANLPKDIDNFITCSFKGGRTEVFKLRNTLPKINYIDVSSMYPSVQKYDELPYGKPVIYSGRFEELKEDEIGFVECLIKAPKIHLPLLMITCPKTGKLIAPVGRIKGIFTTMELKKAISLGYKITKYYKGYKFKSMKGVFSTYVDKYYSLKTKAKKNNNKGLAQICKLMLNSLWGKFAQKCNLTKHVYIKDYNKWHDILEDTSKIIKHFETTNDDNIYVSWMYYEEDEWEHSKFNNTRNIAIASAITSNARLRLYEAMEKAGKGLLYCDTDSIIYEYDKEIDLKIYDSGGLGDWELEDRISEFVGVAPKSYAYKIAPKVFLPDIYPLIKPPLKEPQYTLPEIYPLIETPLKEVAKCKGFSANWITFDMYDNMVNNKDLKYTYSDLHFKRSELGVQTFNIMKELSFVFNKRIIDGIETHPIEI